MTREILNEDEEAAEIVQRLRAKFPELSAQTVEQAVTDARAEFTTAKVRDFVPVLIERSAKARLTSA